MLWPLDLQVINRMILDTIKSVGPGLIRSFAPTAEVPKYSTVLDTSAALATAERLFYIAPRDVDLGAVDAMFLAAVTANDTNFATITIKHYPADGSAATTILLVTTETTGQPNGLGNILAHHSLRLGILTGAPVTILQNDALTITVAKTGSGVVLPSYVLEVVEG